MKIRNLVFQGGGVRAAAYAGAVDVLAARGHLASVRSVAGTSAGSMTACLLAVGAGAKELEESVRSTPFSRFLDGSGGVLGEVWRLIVHQGLHPARQFEQMLRAQIEQICGDGDLTFAGLEQRRTNEPQRYRELFVVASDLVRQTPIVLSAKRHGDLPIWRAVRMSVSIPLVFQPVRYGDGVYVDGGLSWNYPIDLYDHPDPADARPGALMPRSEETLGFCLGTCAENRASREDWRSPPQRTRPLLDFLAATAHFLTNTANRAHVNEADLHRTVFIDDDGIAATDFGASAAVIDRLIENGRRDTTRYFDHRVGARIVDV
jgi:NTE family protein